MGRGGGRTKGVRERILSRPPTWGTVSGPRDHNLTEPRRRLVVGVFKAPGEIPVWGKLESQGACDLGVGCVGLHPGQFLNS